jgi:hypothetical protein
VRLIRGVYRALDGRAAELIDGKVDEEDCPDPGRDGMMLGLAQVSSERSVC